MGQIAYDDAPTVNSLICVKSINVPTTDAGTFFFMMSFGYFSDNLSRSSI